jgi:hypothetical protein
MQPKRKRSLFPKPLSECVEPLARPLFKEQAAGLARLWQQWESIMGPKLAACCYPEKIQFPKNGRTQGTLVVAVAHGFALEVQYAQVLILERVNSYYGYQAISRLQVGTTFTPAMAKPRPKRITKPLALDAGCTEQVEDAELKAALASFARQLAGA